MTTLEPDQPRPYSTWLAHHRMHMLVAWIIGYSAAVAAAKLVPWWVTLPAVLVLWAAEYSAQIGEARHGRILCPQCMADFPLLGPQEAEEKSRYLYYYHHRRLWLAVFQLALVGLGVTVSVWFIVASMLCAVTDLRLIQVHRRLCPWCPCCNPNRGKGDKSPTPIPTPVQTGGA